MAFSKERRKADGTVYYEIIAAYKGTDEEKKKKAPYVKALYIRRPHKQSPPL